MCELSLWLCLYYHDCKSSSQLLKIYYFFFFFKDAKGQETNVEIEIVGEKVCVIQLVES